MKKIVSVVMILVLAGCATVISGTKQNVNVSTNMAERSECVLRDAAGASYSIAAPGRVQVKRGNGPIDVVCNTNGVQGQKTVDENLEPWFFGTILLLWPTIPVDLLTGAYQRYPDDINVNIINPPLVTPGAVNAR
jgi:hypothetical protein